MHLYLYFAFFYFMTIAAQAQKINQSIKIYRNTKSLYASGEISKQDLEKTKIREFSEYSTLLLKNNKEFWVDANLLARDIGLSNEVFNTQDQQTYQILDSKDSMILGSNLIPVYNYIDTQLFIQGQWWS